MTILFLMLVYIEKLKFKSHPVGHLVDSVATAYFGNVKCHCLWHSIFMALSVPNDSQTTQFLKSFYKKTVINERLVAEIQ